MRPQNKFVVKGKFKIVIRNFFLPMKRFVINIPTKPIYLFIDLIKNYIN